MAEMHKSLTILMFFAVSLASAASAQTLDELKAQAAKALAAQDFKAALTLLEAAYAIDPQADLGANIGFVQYRIGDRVKAAAALERFLSTNPPASKARKAQDLVDRLKPRIKIWSDPSGATVVAEDGGARGLTPVTLRLLAGDHAFTLKKRDHKPVDFTVRVREGQPDILRRTLMPMNVERKKTVLFAKSIKPVGKPVSPWAWIALSGAVVAGAGAGGLYTLTDDALSARDAARSGTAWDGHQGDAETLNTAMWASAGLAVASGAISAWLFAR
ncbi:MAG: tetratricopeptide (TPR) repeat protein [Bradymonadia bacterium]|jgi:tetratricopeptide (TPR) repeat protein